MLSRAAGAIIPVLSSQSKPRIHESLELAFSPLRSRMDSSGVTQAVVVRESDAQIENGQDVDYPVPMSPFADELSKEVELQRALVAEAAMKSGPAIGKENVLFEDDWLVIVNKPRGLYCEHVFATVPSLTSSSGAASLPHFHMANRLDRDTSGIMVITKCREAAAKLTRAFTNREVQKTYLAQCARAEQLLLWRTIKIESGHGRSRYGAWRVYAKHDVGRRLPGGSAVRGMVTRVEILAGAALVKPGLRELVVGSNDEGRAFAEVAKSGGGEEVAVVRAFPETGRTHQIRLHCQYLGLPLCGDVKYGGPLTWQGVLYDSHALHAESLAFSHPITKEPLQVIAPCPTWATQLGVKPFEFRSSSEPSVSLSFQSASSSRSIFDQIDGALALDEQRSLQVQYSTSPVSQSTLTTRAVQVDE